MFRATRQIDYRNPVSNSPLNRGLVGWWLALPQRMGGGRWMDLCGKSHGVFTGSPTWSGSVGRPGGFGCLKFGTAGQLVTVSSTNLLTGQNEFTVSGWCQHVNNVSFDDLAIAYSYDSGVGDGWYLNSDGNSASKIVARKYESYSVASAVADSATATATWFHYCVTCTTAGLLTLYVNGVAQSTTATRSGTISNNNSTIIGAGTHDSGRIHALDDVRINARCMSADEAVALYNDSRTGYQQTLNRLPMRVFNSVAAGGGVFGHHYYYTMGGAG